MASGKLSSKTSIRFSLRFIFLITTLVGIVCAVLAPLIRSWPQAKQTAFLLLIAAMALTTLVTPFFFVFVRNYLERSAGEPLARVVGKKHTTIRFCFFIMVCIFYMIAALILLELIKYANWRGKENLTGSDLTYIFVSYFMTTLGIIFFCLFWWGGYELEIRSEGIIHDTLSYKPWKSLKSFHWEGERLMLTRKRGAFFFIVNWTFLPVILSVHTADKPLIDQCLRKFLPRESNDQQP